MPDPYATLDLQPGCSDEAIRRRYLELVREYSPERAPQRFAEIRQAYEQLRDPVGRLRNQLFLECDHESFDAIIEDAHARLRSARIPVDSLLALAEKS